MCTHGGAIDSASARTAAYPRSVHSLSSTPGVVALVACAIAAIALLWVIALTVSLRRVRRAQRFVLGDHNEDLVAHAAHLQESFEALAGYVEDASTTLNNRVLHAERRLDHAVSHRALVRYDAYGEMSGRQSVSIALLDAGRNGFVLSSIHHRDTARLYIKRVSAGIGEFELSPEETEAIKQALNDEAAATSKAKPSEAKR